MEFWILDGKFFRRRRKLTELKLDPHFELPIPNRRGEETTETEQNVTFLLHPHKKPLFSPSPSAYVSPAPVRSNSRLAGMRNAGGEIVEVQGGHIVRSIGRKDRHSKVCTAKGPRDRRVRLSAHTAIQFYDVQDRLGYDRPSKAVDWLIKNAKAAIDELSELPAWHPSSVHEISNKKQKPQNEQPVSSAGFSFSPSNVASSSFLPLCLDSDSIAAVHENSNKGHDFQDLRLSLQSIQDPIFNHPNPIQHHHFSFDNGTTGFADQNQRMVCEGGSGVYAFNMSPVLFGQGQVFTQRGPLQSSNSTLIRPWMETIDQQMQQGIIPEVSSVGYSSGGRSFSGFRFPVGIHGEDVLDEGMSEKPSCGSSASHY